VFATITRAKPSDASALLEELSMVPRASKLALADVDGDVQSTLGELRVVRFSPRRPLTALIHSLTDIFLRRIIRLVWCIRVKCDVRLGMKGQIGSSRFTTKLGPFFDKGMSFSEQMVPHSFLYHLSIDANCIVVLLRCLQLFYRERNFRRWCSERLPRRCWSSLATSPLRRAVYRPCLPSVFTPSTLRY
jgi:hypothetical protein